MWWINWMDFWIMIRFDPWMNGSWPIQTWSSSTDFPKKTLVLMTWKIIIHPLYTSEIIDFQTYLWVSRKNLWFTNIMTNSALPPLPKSWRLSAQGANRRHGPSGASPNDPTDRRWRRCATGRKTPRHATMNCSVSCSKTKTSMIHSNFSSTNSDYIYHPKTYPT